MTSSGACNEADEARLLVPGGDKLVRADEEDDRRVSPLLVAGVASPVDGAMFGNTCALRRADLVDPHGSIERNIFDWFDLDESN